MIKYNEEFIRAYGLGKLDKDEEKAIKEMRKYDFELHQLVIGCDSGNGRPFDPVSLLDIHWGLVWLGGKGSRKWVHAPRMLL